MSDVTRILSAIEQDDPAVAEQLLPLAHEKLRKLAAQKTTQEKGGQTLQATALVRDVYPHLADVERAQNWDSRGHLFAAATEATRWILVKEARRRGRQMHGGQLLRHDLNRVGIVAPATGPEANRTGDE